MNFTVRWFIMEKKILSGNLIMEQINHSLDDFSVDEEDFYNIGLMYWKRRFTLLLFRIYFHKYFFQDVSMTQKKNRHQIISWLPNEESVLDDWSYLFSTLIYRCENEMRFIISVMDKQLEDKIFEIEYAIKVITIQQNQIKTMYHISQV